MHTTDTRNEQVKSEEGESKPTPTLSFSRVFVTPIDTAMPSSFYVEVSNTGTAPANDFTLIIDFGESKAEECEILPTEIVNNQTSESSVIKSISISKLAKKQSLYVVCSTNSPSFKSITLGGGNVEHDKQLTFEAYKEQLNGESISFYEGLLRAILGALAAIFLFYLFFRLVGTL